MCPEVRAYRAVMLVRVRRRQRQKVGWNSDCKWRAVVVETARLMSGRGGVLYPLGVEGSKSGVHGGDAASVSWWAALANEIATRHRCGR